MPTMKNRSEAVKLLEVLQDFRELDAEIQSQCIAVFLTVVARGGENVSMAEIQKDLDMPQSSVSRNVALLSKWSRHGQKGHDLLESHEDPKERRRKLCRVTAKGKRFIERIFKK
tara:strand:- start:9193 stop:9534 length:342 start_codon:yes stop_codon:yes gene_type:complete